jgi:hypothetical protein
MRNYLCLALTLFAGTTGVFSNAARAQLLDTALPMQYIPLGVPCRAVDTRMSGGPISGGTFRNVSPGGGGCSIAAPSSGVIAYAVNVTVVPHGSLSYLSLWPAGELQPVVSTLNSFDGRVKANAAIVTGGTDGQVSVYVSNTADVILDVSGYFVAEVAVPPTNTFFPITPCRVIDTRVSNGTLGAPSLVTMQQRNFVLSLSSCNLPQAPTEVGGAYSVNVTVIPKNNKPVGYVTVWGTSVTQPTPPTTSTINDTTGTVVANAAIVTVNPGTGGGLSIISSDDTDVVVDVNGYFAFSQLVTGGLSLYTLPPCRVLDTRQALEAFEGQLTVPVTTNNNCSVPGTAKAFVMNATAIPSGFLGYISLWQNGATQPVVSTLNAFDGAITSNMALVGTTNGSIDAYASQPAQLLLDISGYFAP